jgi:hypothetical protein
MELEQSGPAVKLSITHTIERDASKFIAAVSGGLAEGRLQPEVAAGDGPGGAGRSVSDRQLVR